MPKPRQSQKGVTPSKASDKAESEAVDVFHAVFPDACKEIDPLETNTSNVLYLFCFTTSVRQALYRAVGASVKPCAKSSLPISEAPLLEGGFKTDSEYLNLKEAQIVLRSYTLNVGGANMPQSVLKELQRVSVEPARALEILNLCNAELASFADKKLSLSTRKPRVIRVCEEMRLSQIELEAIVYVLVMHCGSFAVQVISHCLIPSSLGRIVGMEPHQLMDFLTESRPHIKQGLIHMISQQLKPVLTDIRLTMQMEVVAALSGVELTEEQLIKLEKTALANVLLVEKGLPPNSPLQRNSPMFPSSANSPTLNGQEGEAFEDDEEVEEIEIDENTDVEGLFANMPQSVIEELVAAAKQSKKNKRDSGDKSGEVPTGRRRTEAAPTGGSVSGDGEDVSRMHRPYDSDIDYIDECCKQLSTVVKLRNTEGDMKDEEESYDKMPKNKVEAAMRELKGRDRVLRATLKSRMKATREAGRWLPRVELVAEKLGLTDFEKQILQLMVGNVVSHDLLIAINGRYVMRDGQREMTVGYVLFVLCENLKERVDSRKCFYKTAPLLKHGLISIALSSGRTSFNTDIMDYMVDMDRKIVSYLMGEDMECGEMVPGSKLYMPDVPINNVVLPPDTKSAVLSTIQHYELFEKSKRKFGFGEGLGNSTTGLVFLFYGPSGTGKTMLANAIANDMGRKILLVSLVQFKSDGKSAEILRFVFREAKLNDAIIFFDECESFFESRETNPLVTSILAEFEQYDGMIILATNRAQIIDEAMNRRINLMVEFKLPDHSMREKIWAAHLPTSLQRAEDVSLESIAIDYELSGGLIRNAALAALSRAVARDKSDTPMIQMEDLVHGARQQLRGLFQAEKVPFGTELYITPKRHLEDLIVDDKVGAMVRSIAMGAKSRSTLFTQWGFEETNVGQSNLYVFSGPSGVGKSLAAEAVAHECGVSIRLSNLAEVLLAREVSINNIFEEAKKLNAMVVFDSAEQLFEHSDRARQIGQLIQYHARTYPRPVFLLATTAGGVALDLAPSRLDVKCHIQFQLPSKSLRSLLWKRFIPEGVPRADNIKTDDLADKIVSAKFIQAVCFNACCRAALRKADERQLRMSDLLEEFEEQTQRENRLAVHSSMFA